ncbi:MAG: PilZ domain-containing protein [Desulfobacterales bacterium]|nr:PilZ domain-containing protein [Desulfobacterales bacterium]
MPKEEHGADSERREHQRHSVNIQVEIVATSGQTTGVMIGTSLEGLCIKTSMLIEPATNVMITFSTGEKVDLLAEVAWILDKIDRGLPSYVAGLKINSVSVNGEELRGIAKRTAFLQDLIT